MPRLGRPHAVAVRLLVLASLVLGSTGCARLFSSYDVAPNGMPRSDDALRRLLVAGRADSALVRVEPRGESAPEDELLRSLYGGILGHYAGRYDSSSAALQLASDLADDRYTKRVSRAVLSLVTNDKALPYEPGGTERLLIHYYAALNYLRQHDTSGAAVEARRLSALLERDDAPADKSLHGWLRYFSGTVFEAAGERNDADVAYRNARALLGSGVLPAGDESPGGERTADLGAGSGEVVVLVEQGFVAHRVEQAITVPLYDFEMDRLSGGETASRLTAAANITARVLAQALAGSGQPSHYYDTRPRTLAVAPLPREAVLRECAAATATKAAADPGKDRDQKPDPPKKSEKNPLPAPIAGPGTLTGSAGGMRGSGQRPPARSAAPRRTKERSCTNPGNPYLLRIAWPVFRHESVPAYNFRVSAARPTDRSVGAQSTSRPLDIESPPATEPFQLRTDLSAAVSKDFDAERGAILARTIVRGVTKAAVTRSIEKAPGDSAEGWGRLLGALVNLGTALLEQADTRSWQLLPDRIGLVRLSLPPGEHLITVELDGPGGGGLIVDLGTAVVVPGEITFLSARLWN